MENEKERIIYESKVTYVGTDVPELVNSGMFILFCDEAPEMLREVSVCHTHEKPPFFNFKPGDHLLIGDNQFLIESVGLQAMKTFKPIGHFTVRFTNLQDTDLRPGDVKVSFLQEKIPTFMVDQSIRVFRLKNS